MNAPISSFGSPGPNQPIESLDDRSREIFMRIVETYLETGEPMGSRNLARQLEISLSPASIRNVMSDLEHLGLIYAPHISAGRLPTEVGLRYFVDGFLEIGDLSKVERANIESQVKAAAVEKTVDFHPDRSQPVAFRPHPGCRACDCGKIGCAVEAY